MADPAAIDALRIELAIDFGILGMDDTLIGTVLDMGLSAARTRLAIWKAVVGKALTITDVSESGSSRQIGVIFDRAKQMVDFWQQQVISEDTLAGTLPPRPSGASHTAVRV